MKKALSFIIPVAVCFLVGFTASQFQADAIENWYPYLNKPSLTPPNIVFPIAWNILYLCMGISVGFIINSKDCRKIEIITLFVVQLVLNFGWSFLFFYMRNPLLGLIDILLLDFLLILYYFSSYRVSRPAAYLFIPYILWVSFAAYLNIYIFIFN